MEPERLIGQPVDADEFLNDIDDIPGRTDYELTERGEGEFSRLLRDALRRPRPRPDLLCAALALLPALPRDVAINLLRERLSSLEQAQEKARIQQADWAGSPHVIELFGLWEHNSARDAQWTRNLIAHLETGEYAMLGDPNSPGRPGSWWAATHVDD